MSTSTERMRALRERRAAALAPVPGAAPRDPGELLLPAVEQSIEALRLGEPYQAAAQLARMLASAIDEASDQAVALRVLGPQLAKVLDSIGGTPASRVRLPQKAAQRPAPSRVAMIRNEHMNSPAKRKRAGA